MHRTSITQALISLGAGHGQSTFLKVASRATSEVDANYFQAVAELIQKYNQSEHPVGRIIRSGRTVSFHDAAGAWIFPVPFDYCLWTESVQGRAQRLFAGREPGQRVVIYTTGGLSDMAKDRCKQLKLEVMDHVSLE